MATSQKTYLNSNARASGQTLVLLHYALLMPAMMICIWDSIVGFPYWLSDIGFLPWLKQLSPLDSWFVVIGTLTASFVAIFLDKIKNWLFKPKFEIEFNIFRVESVGSLKYKCHLSIKNIGNQPAHNVEVALVEVTHPNSEDLLKLAPLNLPWAHSNHWKLDSLSPLSSRMCVLIDVYKDLKEVGEIPQWVEVPDFEFIDEETNEKTIYSKQGSIGLIPNAHPYFPTYIFPGTTFLKIEVAASNAKLVSKKIKVIFSQEMQHTWDLIWIGCNENKNLTLEIVD